MWIKNDRLQSHLSFIYFAYSQSISSIYLLSFFYVPLSLVLFLHYNPHYKNYIRIIYIKNIKYVLSILSVDIFLLTPISLSIQYLHILQILQP